MKLFALLANLAALWVAGCLPGAHAEPLRAQGTPLPFRPAGTPLPFKIFSPEFSPLAKRLVDEHFQIVRSLGEINPGVLTLLYSKVPAKEMADVGGKFNATDVVMDRTVPGRRLLFAGKTPGLWFVFYEHGGRGYKDNLVVFNQEHGQAWRIAATASGFVEKTDPESLRAALRRGAFVEPTNHPYF